MKPFANLDNLESILSPKLISDIEFNLSTNVSSAFIHVSDIVVPIAAKALLTPLLPFSILFKTSVKSLTPLWTRFNNSSSLSYSSISSILLSKSSSSLSISSSNLSDI